MRPVPTLALIRPEARSRAVLARVEAGLGRAVPAIIAPVMAVVPVAAPYDPAGFAGLILTSAQAAEFARGLEGRPVWCVGARTAKAAQARGAVVQAVAPDAEALVAELAAHPPEGPLLWLRGVHVAGDLAARLREVGIATKAVVIYDQPAIAPTPALLAALQGEAPVILPLYSPRSATLIGQALGRPGAGLTAIALSPRIADAWKQTTGSDCGVCDRPDGAEMTRRIIAALRQSCA